MIPLVDIHCHLLAGLDDGPGSQEEALAMCRLAYRDGVRMAAATAHQNERWAAVSPDNIRQATRQLAALLRDAHVPLTVFPCAEVMVHPAIGLSWQKGELLSVADRGQYLLLEMPHGVCVDLRETIRCFRESGVRPILAHAERSPEMLHDRGRIEGLIRAGCLVQVSSGSIAAPPSSRDRAALRSWLSRGLVHLVGSDGHSLSRRPPKMAEAYNQVRRWAGSAVADRVCSTNGMAVLEGLPIRVPAPVPRRVAWVRRFW
jgi:protein-tyrosine phosphatase